ncbi:MAG: nucleotide exchange factor GrpE [Anaerolineae bacterium]
MPDNAQPETTPKEAEGIPSEAETPAAGEEKAPEKDELETLRQKLAEAEAKAQEYLDQWRRTAAEFANYKKRNEKEQSEITKFANAGLLTMLLPVLDDFERAFQTIPSNLRSLTWVDGLFLIQRKMQMVFEQMGVKPIETEGQKFDPLFHQAVSYEESDGFEEGQIISEVQKGYKFHDRVLRPALVRVSSGKPKEEGGEEQEREQKSED